MTNEANLLVDVQDALEQGSSDEMPPSSAQLSLWAELAHKGAELADPAASKKISEVTLRLVGESEMVRLNQGFRGKTGSTNVLSFPVDDEFDFVTQDGPSLLGDIVICHSVIVREATEQNKTIFNHYAHMVTHGVLHLHGYDHLDDESADQMEALEASILSSGGIENPYN